MKNRRRKRPESYVDRDYRVQASGSGLISTHVKIKDTDLQILADREVRQLASDLALQYRMQIEQYIGRNPAFLRSLTPLAGDPLAPSIIRDMLSAGKGAGVGPMAAVAGAIAEYVGRALLKVGCREVVVENGGDIFLQRTTEAIVAIFAGASPLSMRLGLRIPAASMPLGVCTSSGTVGHSLSFGVADSVTVLADSTSYADAVATRLGNEVGSGRRGQSNISQALVIGKQFANVRGIVIICGEDIGAVGEVELVNLN